MRGPPIDRCPVGIPGFDSLCDGGIVRNSVCSLIGGPGSGKSTFLLQFLWNGVTLYGENGLYLSFEPDVLDTFQDSFAFGWDFSKYDQNGKCKFVKISPKSVINGSIKSELQKYVAKGDVRRIAMDPVSIITMALNKEEEVRGIIFELVSLLKRMKVTVMLADETVDGSATGCGDAKTQFIKFLSDGLIELYSSGLGGETDRALRITKMRRTAHVRGPVPFQITNNGIIVYSKKGK